MTSYVILLRPLMSRRGRNIERVSLQPDALRDLARSVGIQVLDVIVCRGIYDAVLVCHATESATVLRLLEALEGWQTEALLATSHSRCGT